MHPEIPCESEPEEECGTGGKCASLRIEISGKQGTVIAGQITEQIVLCPEDKRKEKSAKHKSMNCAKNFIFFHTRHMPDD